MNEHLDRYLLALADRSGHYLARAVFNPDADYPLLHVRGPEEVVAIDRFAGELGYLDRRNNHLTIKGWQRVDELRARQPDSRQAFVAMWFSPDLQDAWTNGFKPAIEASGYFTPVRIDTIEHNQRIDERIVAEIRRSGLLVADFTGNRGGVYFEAGYALGMGIPVIWTCQKDQLHDVHFDTRQYNHIDWVDPQDLRRRLADRIAATVLPIKPRAV